MAIYYQRTTGSDGAAGTSAGAAWTTYNKGLGAAGISSGDTLYVGGGTYREVVTIAMTSAVAETKIIGDVTGQYTGDFGEVIWTAYLTNDTTAPSASGPLTLAGRDFLTFENISFVTGAGTLLNGATATPQNITFRKCLFFNAGTGTAQQSVFSPAANTALNLLFDSCYFFKGAGNSIALTPVRPATADFDINVQFLNCFFESGGAACIALGTVSGANTFNPGGVIARNCTMIGGGTFMSSAANWSTSVPSYVYNCLIYTATASALSANTSGQIIEDYNLFVCGASPRSNVSIGAHSISNGSYVPWFYTGHEYAGVGSTLKPFGMPKVGSPLLGFGNQAGSPTTDILGITRPALGSVGAYEIGNTAVKETTTKRTGLNAIKILNAGYQNFDVPVWPTSTTISIYARYNGAYAGTLPSMNIVNGGECGVANATATQVGAADTWEQLSLTFTPTSAGIITVRLINSSTATTGAAFFDDFAVT